MKKLTRKIRSKAYETGNYYNLESNLSNKYNNLDKEEKILNLPNYTMKDIEKFKKNCTLIAITRILDYLFLNSLYSLKTFDKYEIYNVVKRKGLELGYNSKHGTYPILVADIMRRSVSFFGYSNKSIEFKSSFFWEFKDFKNEIDNNKPLILNIARGKYKNHSVTVIGYSIFRISRLRTNRYILLYDGWSKNIKYLDFNQFSFNLLLAGLGSINTYNIK